MTKRWIVPSLAKRISTHVQTWEHARRAPGPCAPETCPFITISREFGCPGPELGYRLAERLNEQCESKELWTTYDRELLDRVASEMELRREIIDKLDEQRRGEMRELFDTIIHKRVEDVVLFRKLAEIARSLAVQGRVILVGRGCHLITQDLDNALHVQVVAPLPWRIQQFAKEHQIAHQRAEKRVLEGERQRKKFLKTFFLQDPLRASYFHLAIDSSRFTQEQLLEVILGALQARFGTSGLAE